MGWACTTEEGCVNSSAWEATSGRSSCQRRMRGRPRLQLLN